MFRGLNIIIYTIANLLAIPGRVIPYIDLITNLIFLFGFIIFYRTGQWYYIVSLIILFFARNNANYRFLLRSKIIGDKSTMSDEICVYIYAWASILRYSILSLVFIGLAS